MNIKQNLANKCNYGGCRAVSNIRYIVIHYTGNDGDSDEGNANYFKGVRSASAHYFVDDDSITQSVPDNYVAWSVGGKKYSDCAKTGGGKYYNKCTNNNSISIELCDSVKNGVYDFTENTLKQAAELTKELMRKYNVPIENIIRHFDVTGKICPLPFVRDESKWIAFNNRIKVSDDLELFKAVQKIIKSGITINFNSWKRTDLINLKNVPMLLVKLGGIDKLVADKIISDRVLWNNGKYTADNVRSLLIKYANKLG